MIRGWIMSMAHGGGAGPQKESNLITLLRDTDRDGTVDERHDLLTGLNSPFGVAWHEGTLYVAAADAILAYPYQLGQAEITGEPRVLTPLRWPDQPSLTKDLALSPYGRLPLMPPSVPTRTWPSAGSRPEKGALRSGRVDRETGAARDLQRPAPSQPERIDLPSRRPAVLWSGSVNERDELGAESGAGLHDLVQEALLRHGHGAITAAHVDERVHPPRPTWSRKRSRRTMPLSSHVAALAWSSPTAPPCRSPSPTAPS